MSTKFLASTIIDIDEKGSRIQGSYNLYLDNPSENNKQNLISIIKEYYGVQTAERQYAVEAKQVVDNNEFNGNVANQNVANFYSDPSQWSLIRVKLMAGLAIKDFEYISGNNYVIPNLTQDANEHVFVFNDLSIPITYWSGTAFAAYDQNWLGLSAKPAELEDIDQQSKLFPDITLTELKDSFSNLLKAVSQELVVLAPYQSINSGVDYYIDIYLATRLLVVMGGYTLTSAGKTVIDDIPLASQVFSDDLARRLLSQGYTPALLPLWAQMLFHPLDVTATLFAEANSAFKNALRDPLVINLDGLGVKIQAMNSQSPYFDYTGNSHAEQTAWIKSGSGFLIDTSAPITNNIPKLIESFIELKAFDTSENGIIDVNDQGFSRIGVWVDSNQDGRAQNTEIFSLDQLGITSLSLNSTQSLQSLEDSVVLNTSLANIADGSTRSISQIALNSSKFNTSSTLFTILDSTIVNLPYLHGYGELNSLQQAMIVNPTLLSLLQNIVSSNPEQPNFNALVHDMMMEWAGINSQSIDDSLASSFDPQKLAFLQVIFGNNDSFKGSKYPVLADQAAQLEQSWNQIYSAIKSRLLVQMPNTEYSKSFVFDAIKDVIIPRVSFDQSIQNVATSNISNTTLGWINTAEIINNSIRDVNAYIPQNTADILTSLQVAFPSCVSSVLKAISTGNLNIFQSYNSATTLYPIQNKTNLIVVDQADLIISGSGIRDEIIVQANTRNLVINPIGLIDSDQTIKLDNSFTIQNLNFQSNNNGDLLILSNGFQIVDIKQALTQTSLAGIDSIIIDNISIPLQNILSMEQQVSNNSSNTLYGTQAADTLDGAGIAHKLVGNGGGDTFVYNQGYGSLEINETDVNLQSTNTLVLGTGIAINDMKVSSTQTGDLLITVANNGVIRLNGMLADKSNGIQIVRLADSTTVTRAQLIEMACTGSLTNTAITSWLANQIIDPAGYAGSIHLAGGNSLIKFNLGYGRVEINQHDANPADQNTLLFGAGINPADIVISTDGTGNILLTIGTSGDCVVLDNMAISPSSGVQVVRFMDGTSWSAATIVSQVNTTVQGYYTTYDFNAGMGNIVVSASGISGIAFGAGISINDLSIETNRAGDLIISKGNGDSLTLIGSVRSYAANLFRTELSVQQLSFADGSTLAMGSTPTFIHRNGEIGINNANNTFYLTPGNNLIQGGTTTQANTEINTIVMNRGIGNATADLTGGIGVIRMGVGIKQSDIILQSTDSGDLTVKIASTGDSLLVRNGMYMTPYGPSSLIQSIQFNDGSTMPISLQGFTPTPLTYSWIGVGDGKIMVGSDWGKNTFIVGPNNAQIVAGTGSHYNATGTFNYNTFLYDQGDGNAVIDVTNASGEIDLAPDVMKDSVIYQTDNAGSLIVKFLGNPNDSITLKNDIYSTPYGLASRIGKVVFGNGTHTDLNLTGLNAVNFTWTGNSVGSNYGTNVYDLGRNGASVVAGNGSNIVQFDQGTGAATVDFSGVINSNISLNNVRVMASIQSKDILFQTSGNDLIVRIKDDPNDILTLKGDIARNFYGPVSTVQSLNFADGTVIPINFIGSNAISFTWTGSATGSDYGANIFDLHSSLAKTISAGNGSGSGVYPVSNQNAFLFSMGSGQTTVNLRSGIGSIVMADGITPDQVLFQANNSGDLTVGLKTDSSSKVTFLSDLVSNWFGTTSAINQIKFSDGTVQNLGVVNYQNNPIQFTWTADTNNTVLTGSNYGTNIFNTAPGNDQITTGNGNNTFNYTRGDGRVDVDISQGTGLLNLKGLSLSDTYFQASDDGSLQVNFRSSPMDSIRFTHDVTNNWWGVASALNSIRSDDGSTMAIGSPYYNQGAPIQSTWLGNDIDQTLTGTHLGKNTFILSSANDTINSVNNDTVIAGSGNSIVHANGSTINISTTQGSTSLDGSAIATVSMAGGNLNYSGTGGLIANVTGDSSITILNGSNDQISTIENTHNYIQLGSGTTTVFSHGNDRITGGSLGGNDIINGGSGLMTFFGGKQFRYTTDRYGWIGLYIGNCSF